MPEKETSKTFWVCCTYRFILCTGDLVRWAVPDEARMDNEDYAVTIIPIKRSVVFWEASEVRRWFEALQFDSQVSFC